MGKLEEAQAKITAYENLVNNLSDIILGYVESSNDKDLAYDVVKSLAETIDTGLAPVSRIDCSHDPLFRGSKSAICQIMLITALSQMKDSGNFAEADVEDGFMYDEEVFKSEL